MFADLVLVRYQLPYQTKQTTFVKIVTMAPIPTVLIAFWFKDLLQHGHSLFSVALAAAMLVVLCAALVLCSALLPADGQVVSDRGKLWQDAIIRFKFASSVSDHLQSVLREAMNEWEDNTCLRFLERGEERDYVEFTSEPNKQYCTSDVVGRQGGRQVIVLGYSCQSKGELMHTLGHVIGFWNEQARPDRNQYVTIRTRAIETGQEDNFKIQSPFSVGYEGMEYSYGSIMHLGPLAYSKDGAPTIEVKEEGATIGQRSGLHESDIIRTRRLYQCPGQGRSGKLTVEIINAESLTILDNPRVEVRGVDIGGVATTFTTAVRTQNRNPVWNQLFEFPVPPGPHTWQFIRVHIQGVKNSLGMPLTVPIQPGSHPIIRHCIDNTHMCPHRLNFRYTFREDGNECNPHPCNNRGTCVDGFVDFQCSCLAGYSSRHCQDFTCNTGQTVCQTRSACTSPVCFSNFECEPGFCCTCATFLPRVQLIVKIINARNIPDLDPSVFRDRSDPYIVVTRPGERRETETAGGNQDPDYDEDLFFGCHANIPSSKFTVTGYDEDGGFRGGDDKIGSFEVDLGQETNFPFTRTQGLEGEGGTVTFQVRLAICQLPTLL